MPLTIRITPIKMDFFYFNCNTLTTFKMPADTDFESLNPIQGCMTLKNYLHQENENLKQLQMSLFEVEVALEFRPDGSVCPISGQKRYRAWNVSTIHDMEVFLRQTFIQIEELKIKIKKYSE